MVETEAGFFLCVECETNVLIAFEEFELSDAPPIGGVFKMAIDKGCAVVAKG